MCLPKTCRHGTKSVEVSQGSMEWAAQNSNQRPQCLLAAEVRSVTMLDQASFSTSKRSAQNAFLVVGGTTARALAEDSKY